jgi:hypothetical protein
VAVYERGWKRWEGERTTPFQRFRVIPVSALRDVFTSRIFSAFFLLCFLPSLAAATLIYLHYNVSALEVLNLRVNELVAINGAFFLFFQGFTDFLAFLIAFTIGPALISADLANNALPLYLSRPITRTGYVAGKFAALLVPLSLVTWIPGLLLVLLQTSLEGFGWLSDNLRIPAAIFAGSMIWIVVLSLLMLAASAWVKRKSFARILVVGYFFTIGAFGTAINVSLGTNLGSLLSLTDTMTVLNLKMFGVEGVQVNAMAENLPWTYALAGLAVMGTLCLLALLKKVRAYEVVK